MTLQEAARRIEDHMSVHKLSESRAQKISEALNIAVGLLRACDKKSKTGCKYCIGEEVIAWDLCGDGIVVENYGEMHMLSGGDWEAKINYCPMCGKRLNKIK